MKPILVSSGEPAGIGPDICLALAGSDYPMVVLGDKQVISERAKAIGRSVILHDYQSGRVPVSAPNHLTVYSIPAAAKVIPGELNKQNAPYVLQLLEEGVTRCLSGEFAALVTAPVHKGIINDAGVAFTGHTEFLAKRCGVDHVVMMLTCDKMKVALATTHIPLREVADAITPELLTQVITIVYQSLQKDFGLSSPRLLVAGLNPHAGEGGHIGQEEIKVILPTIKGLQQKGWDIQGPYPADTLFIAEQPTSIDAFIAMYHDQGLPVIKYADFKTAVNVTLGLPIIRTSVDHGTALALAGKGQADSNSLLAAVDTAYLIAQHRDRHANH